ncbi:vanadium-dependent haloperoxidase [Nocardiopsis aegyptia]|uniref:vanadium-dependent haloperoxidase n=1 Tax=Nocardiopsis aegyptia TaxID=220378 RepID=UPI00366DC2AE
MPQRRAEAIENRIETAEQSLAGIAPTHGGNGEEADYPYIANYAKGLPHDDAGEVDPDAYRLMVRALQSGDRDDFERIPLGGDKPLGTNGPEQRPLVNPQAGLAFDTQGPDAQQIAIPPAPRIDSPQNSAEMGELYWMALCRDVPFSEFDTHPLVAAAATDLTESFSDFRGPKEDGRVTPATLFRGDTSGDVAGPYLSQFMLLDVPLGTLLIDQRHDTVEEGLDHVLDFPTWLEVQRGRSQPREKRNTKDRRYIRNPRDLAHYVHHDALYQAYLNAALILLGRQTPFDGGNPYHHSDNQQGFGTYGGPHLLTLVTEIATRALKAVWYQKWNVHRRLRPETFGGRIHAHLDDSVPVEYAMIDEEILESGALAKAQHRWGVSLLPQAFPEGSPVHPSYGAGHATVAGACVTVLKAWFDTSTVLEDPVVPDARGRRLVPCTGDAVLTVGGELDKLAANISIGRNMAGVHWRTDYTASVRLGEEIAIGLLREQTRLGNESAHFTLRRFDGTSVTI